MPRDEPDTHVDFSSARVRFVRQTRTMHDGGITYESCGLSASTDTYRAPATPGTPKDPEKALMPTRASIRLHVSTRTCRIVSTFASSLGFPVCWLTSCASCSDSSCGGQHGLSAHGHGDFIFALDACSGPEASQQAASASCASCAHRHGVVCDTHSEGRTAWTIPPPPPMEANPQRKMRRSLIEKGGETAILCGRCSHLAEGERDAYRRGERSSDRGSCGIPRRQMVLFRESMEDGWSPHAEGDGLTDAHDSTQDLGWVRTVRTDHGV